jgi:hypothetical protein
MKTTISRPALPGVAAAQPAPAPPARRSRGGSAPTCKRTLRGIVIAGVVAATLLLGTVAAWATVPPGPQDQSDQGQALSQSEQERTLARHRALGALDTLAAQPAAGGQERTLARHRALGALGMQRLAAQRKALYQSQLDTTLARHRALGTLAAQPAATIRPAAPGPGVDVLATLLVGLVGGLLGGAAAMAGWTATTRRRADRPATGS